jgi:hypothetical protein
MAEYVLLCWLFSCHCPNTRNKIPVECEGADAGGGSSTANIPKLRYVWACVLIRACPLGWAGLTCCTPGHWYGPSEYPTREVKPCSSLQTFLFLLLSPSLAMIMDPDLS